MTTSPVMRALPLLFAAVALSAADARAQDPPPPQPEPVAELVFEREVFDYPSFPRRNPFNPLLGAGAGGPRYEQLTLIGIMWSPSPASSVAVLSTGRVSVAQDGTLSGTEGDAYYLKVGQRAGNVTVVEIQRDRVVVDVEEFGITDRRTMIFVPRQGGTS